MASWVIEKTTKVLGAHEQLSRFRSETRIHMLFGSCWRKAKAKSVSFFKVFTRMMKLRGPYKTGASAVS